MESPAPLVESTVRPVFIVGPHRSGTTILYKVLAETGCFNITSALHIINRRRLATMMTAEGLRAARQALTEEFDRLGLKNRSFDAVPITPDIPEEYAFALEHQGRRPRLTLQNWESFNTFCREVQAVQDPAKPLLLKNPYDANNFVPIAERLPHARFVFLFRHPFDVINSQMKAVRSLLAEKNEYVALVSERYREAFESSWKIKLARWIYSERFGLLAGQTIRHVSQICDYTAANHQKLGPVSCALTYRELCERPNETIERVLEFLDLRPEERQDYSKWIEPREPKPLAEMEPRRPMVEERNKEYIRMFLSA